MLPLGTDIIHLVSLLGVTSWYRYHPPGVTSRSTPWYGFQRNSNAFAVSVGEYLAANIYLIAKFWHHQAAREVPSLFNVYFVRRIPMH